jgi:hypothetical protein
MIAKVLKVYTLNNYCIILKDNISIESDSATDYKKYIDAVIDTLRQ